MTNVLTIGRIRFFMICFIHFDSLIGSETLETKAKKSYVPRNQRIMRLRARETITFDMNATPTASDVASHFKFPNEADTLPDFSYAGYQAGSATLPHINNIIRTIQPTNDQTDRTPEIQDAIDSMSKSNTPGVILFQAGDYWLSGDSSIRLSSSVVLRGEESVPSKTVIHVSGSPRNLFEFGDPKASGKLQPDQGTSPITQPYVGVGARSAEVENAAVFKVGQSIVMRRLATQAWIEAMNMNDLVRNDKHQTWIAVGTSINQEREIQAIEGNRIFWEMPLTDSIDLSFSNGSASVVAYQPPSRTQQSGIENMVFSQTPSAAQLLVGTKTILPIMIGGAQDCWIRNIHAKGFNQFAYFGRPSRRITMSDFVIIRDEPTSNGGKGALPLDITLAGSQALILRGTTVGDQDTAAYIVSTGSQAAGPNVVSGYTATGSTRHMIEPHQRWSTGILIERSRVGQINLKNRGIMGSGHGWAIGSGVIWSCSATKLTAEDPPMSKNFQVNSKQVKDLKELGSSDYQFANSQPATSLYHIQLVARIGAEAAEAIVKGASSLGAVIDDAPSIQKTVSIDEDLDLSL